MAATMRSQLDYEKRIDDLEFFQHAFKAERARWGSRLPDTIIRNMAMSKLFPDIVGARQYFDTVTQDPPIANLTAVTATTETGLWNVPLYTPIHAYEATPAKTWRVTAGGIASTGGSGTLIITPRLGTTTSGITMGASTTQTVPVSVTNVAWTLTFVLVCRTLGAAGANSTVMGTGTFAANAATSAGAAWVQSFGGTSAAVDLTVETGVFMGWTLSVAGSSTPMYAIIQSLN